MKRPRKVATPIEPWGVYPTVLDRVMDGLGLFCLAVVVIGILALLWFKLWT